MMPLTAADFPAFFAEMNEGASPYPWQERLARDVFNDHQWPECLDLPTGTGKTAVLEIAIFHLALEARQQAQRRAPTRIAFAVDRRLIVDQAFDRAKKIQSRLVTGIDSVAGSVASQLQFLAGNGNAALCVQALRGGLPRESDWARTPVQPTVLVSTVDQVGSRLLFRGYGISASMRPIHAGLLGSDCLIFLDEAHLSEPFRQSLEWIARYRSIPWTEIAPAPWGVVSLSATPRQSDCQKDPFRLNPQDEVHKILGPRLAASKPAELREVLATNLARTYADIAGELRMKEKIENVLIVVNRVDLARAIFSELKSERAMLLTGRVREIDRERIVDDLERAMQPGHNLFVVATQCVEAGADYDFDALVTQIAPLDALRQRFGRLNRKGRDIQANAVIVATKEELRSKKPDPIYGFATRNAWNLLQEIARSEETRACVDFGSLALKHALGSRDITQACNEKLDAPVMPPAYVALWACTNPVPSPEPDVPLFLHGPERATADVEIVWRGDLKPENLGFEEKLIELLALSPPRPAETLAVPIWKVQAWLAGEPDAGRLGDLEGEREPEDSGTQRGRRVLRWCGAEDGRTNVIRPQKIRPGDVIVVPAEYGGCDEWGWTGLGEPKVDDKGLQAAARLRTRTVAIRLHPDLFPDQEAWNPISKLLEQYNDNIEGLRDKLQLPIEWEQELEQIELGTEDIVFYVDDKPAEGLVLTGRRIKPTRETSEPSTESNAAGNFSRDAATLADHTRSVATKARLFADSSGVSDRVRNALLFAAHLHDSGKGDRRFQAYLQNGAPSEHVLAKSKRRPRPAEQRIRGRVGLPDHWRHEALSVRVAIGHPQFCVNGDFMDRELALWLIGTHHGWGRPFFPHDDLLDEHTREICGATGEPVKLTAAPGPQRLDFDWNGLDWAALFDCLHRRYGAWELARFEAFLRLADHRASEEADVL